MEEAQEDKEMREFSWSTLFIVSGLSCFIFSWVLKLLDGTHPPLLLKIGSLAIILAFFNWFLKRLVRSSA